MKTNHTNITVSEGIATFEDGREIEATVELLKAAPELLKALQRLLGVTELNLDDMEPETRNAVEEASALCAELENQ